MLTALIQNKNKNSISIFLHFLRYSYKKWTLAGTSSTRRGYLATNRGLLATSGAILVPLGSGVTCTKAHKAFATTHSLQSILQNLYKLQAGTMDSTQQQSLYRERRRIEGAQTEKSRQRHKTLEECIGRPEGMFRGICIYLCSSEYTCCYNHIFAIRMGVDRTMTCLYRRSTVHSKLTNSALPHKPP